MSTFLTSDVPSRTPLEDFIRDYVETIGGDWDQVEPQVYDLLVPTDDGAAALDMAGRGVLRVAFDPEALPEHPGAQFASFGTPLVDRLLADAVHRGELARLHAVGLNLSPHDLPARVRRGLTFGPEHKFRVERVRPLDFVQAVYYFQATFVSDQKEQEVVPVGLDLHYGRQVRHLEQLLDHSRLSDQPGVPLAEARRLSLAAGYPIARERVLRTVAAMANARTRELSERLAKQVTRMRQYYGDLRQELDEQARRAQKREEEPGKVDARRAALDREERLRISELKEKNTLRIQLRLLHLEVVHQPKILLHAEVSSAKASVPLQLVWDPLTEALEAPPCPSCGRPGFAFQLTRHGKLACPHCSPT